MKINPIISRPIASKSLSSRPFVRKVALGAMAVGAAMGINACSYISNPVKKQCTDAYEYLEMMEKAFDHNNHGVYIGPEHIDVADFCKKYGTYYAAMYFQRRADYTRLANIIAGSLPNMRVLNGEYYEQYRERIRMTTLNYYKDAVEELKDLEEQDALMFKNKKNKYLTADECIFHLDLIAQTDHRISEADYDEYERKSTMFEVRMGETNSIKKAQLIAYKQRLIDEFILKSMTRNYGPVSEEGLESVYRRMEQSELAFCCPLPDQYLEIVK